MRFYATAALAFWLLSVNRTGHAGIILEFNYSYDTTDFFAVGSDARTTLQAAGDFFESILADDLTSIQVSGVNTWSAVFTNPTDGTVEVVDNLVVPADTLVVYVGARNMGGSSLGRAGPGGFAASGSLSWATRVELRGESEDDFGPWGGSLSVDSSAAWHKNWTSFPGATENDLYSVLLHEIAHILGVGTASSWQGRVNEAGHTFAGPAAAAEYGASVPLTIDHGHWAEGTMSRVYGGTSLQEAAADPTLTIGTRKLFTALDVAALQDTGWTITPLPVPEPDGFAWLGICLLAVRRRGTSRT